MSDSIDVAINALNEDFGKMGQLKAKKEILAWLLAYHRKAFDLHGRYLAHEVIGWLVHDYAQEFIGEEGEQE